MPSLIVTNTTTNPFPATANGPNGIQVVSLSTTIYLNVTGKTATIPAAGTAVATDGIPLAVGIPYFIANEVMPKNAAGNPDPTQIGVIGSATGQGLVYMPA